MEETLPDAVVQHRGAGDERDILAPLMAALAADAAILSLHLDEEDAPCLLAFLGDAEQDAQTTAEILDHATRFGSRVPDDRGATLNRSWLEERAGGEGGILSIPLSEERGGMVVFTALFQLDRAPDRRIITAALQRWLPMIEAYFRLWLRNKQHANRIEIMRAAVDAVGLGIVIIDREGGEIFANQVAENILREGQILRRRGSKLVARDLGETMKLQAMLASAIGANLGDVQSQRQRDCTLLKLSGGDRPVVITATPAVTSATRSGAAAAMLIINDGGASDATVLPACALYGLSAVESELACHIVAGRSLQEASSVMRVKEQTARTYLKHIFLKTEVNRQAELVRLLLSSLVPTSGRLSRPA